MNNEPHAVVHVSTEPFNFRSSGVNPSLNGREAIRWRLKAAFNRHEMPGKTGEVGPPASGLAFFTPPYSRYALNGCLALRGAGYRQQKREAKSMKKVQSEATRKSSPPHQGLLPSRRKGAHRGRRQECRKNGVFLFACIGDGVRGRKRH